jgi:hypothetical protein
MKKRILSNEDEASIIKKYTEESIGIEALATKFSVGKLKIKSILIENNIPFKKKGAQVSIGNSFDIEKSRINKYTSSDDNKKLIVKCKSTGKQFDDVNNLSGALTNHILLTYGDVPIPSNTYQRKKYEKEYGKKWFEEYFDIIEIEKETVLKCPYCDWSTTDIENKSGCFTKHIYDTHNKTISDVLVDAPELSKLYKTYFYFLNVKDSFNENNSVMCLECNELFLGITNKHLSVVHNMSIDDYKQKWGNDVSIYSKDTLNILKENAILTNKNMDYFFVSKAQIEISEFIKSLGFDIVLSDKKTLNGKEIDILVKDKNIGFEYNGLLWHSEKYGKHKTYHIDKTITASNNNIKLYQIFEDEWVLKKDIVCERIKHILGINKNMLYARNCEVKKIDFSAANEFLNKTHIQGSNKSNINYGAFYDDKLVAVMTFSKLRKVTGYSNNNKDYYELNRFSSSNVTGIASKILKQFIKDYNPKKIISYADRRWTPIGENTLYDKLGFNLIGTTQPNYWYMKNYKIREHRFNYRKDKLVSDGFDKNKTEFQIMSELGYEKIWDCGSFKYELSLE